MKLSARSRYAARILLELAKEGGVAPMSASTLSQHTGVSVQFVEQILKPLKQKGLTKSIRGAAGGHKLAKSAADISLGEVVRLMEGGIKLSVCCGAKSQDCPRKEGCMTRKAWVQISSTLEKELDSITLDSLLHADTVCPEGYAALGNKADKATAVAAAAERPITPANRVARPVVRRVRGVRRINGGGTY